ncbi:transglycosylase SLT domain-containing protein [Rhodoferax sp.]|jgi:soluble lytic murein transglycosylase-like protein|uniref:transglycosylase SLT domain-containing protein n=1 Tax=Rhodoferax sp. TaxID=50421 RepID=UPI0037852F51
MTVANPFKKITKVFPGVLTRGFFALTHSGFTLLGLGVVFVAITLLARPELREASETALISWLQDRQVALDGFAQDADAGERATAANPKDLPKPQAAVAYWLSRKYRVAPEPLSALVVEAFETGKKVNVDPELILAVMAIESGFNPFAQSPMGAQGLMQVMTKVHSDKYESFGGQLAAFDPLSNLRVGVRVLKECIARAGSVEGGLKLYVGAANLEDDGGYAAKVMAEYARIQRVAAGQPATPDTATPTPSQTTGGERLASLVGS